MASKLVIQYIKAIVPGGEHREEEVNDGHSPTPVKF